MGQKDFGFVIFLDRMNSVVFAIQILRETYNNKIKQRFNFF